MKKCRFTQIFHVQNELFGKLGVKSLRSTFKACILMNKYSMQNNSST